MDPKHRKRLTRFLVAAAAAATTTACGPSIKTAVRYSAKPATESELKQSKEGLTIELASLERIPPELLVQLPTCSADGHPALDEDKKPVTQPFPLLHWNRGQDISKVSILNDTDHVMRLSQAVIRLSDPAGNSYEILSKEDLASLAAAERPCLLNPGAAQIRTLKLLDRNVELMPGSTWRGYAVFALPREAAQQAGTWKYTFYEMPVKVDDTGRPVKTARFEMRYLMKKMIDTYEEGLLGDRKLLSTKEAE